MPRLLADKGQSTPTVEQVARRIDEISTIPRVALQVMQVAQNPDSGAADLKKVMEGDPALSARILRCVNSSAYAAREQITNLQQAIAYLGLKQVRNLAMAASVSRLFQQDEVIGLYRRSHLWRHLVSVAICARLIAMRVRLMDFEDAFLAGLLHDVGIILEDQHVHTSFFAVLRSLDREKRLSRAELAQLGFSHTELGEKVASLWGFPKLIRVAIRYHHAPQGYQGEHLRILQCVEVANLICSVKGITSIGLQLVRLSPDAVRGLSLSQRDLQVLAEDLDHEIELNGGLFQT